MSHSISCVYTHIIFSTKHRKHFINDEIAPRLHCYLRSICDDLGCPSLEIGGWYDHIHILCLLSRNIALKSLLEEVKKRSSKWIKPLHPDCAFFYWQTGYAAFSVGQDGLDRLRAYIRNQHQHHASQTFQDESRALYIEHNLTWDERYAWD